MPTSEIIIHTRLRTFLLAYPWFCF